MIKPKNDLLLVAVLLGTGTSFAAMAQTITQTQQLSIQPLVSDQQLKPTGDQAGIKLDPITLFPGITAAAGHTDNVVLAPQNTIGSDYYALTPALIAELKNGPHTFTAGYVGQYGWYGSSSADDFKDHLVGATGEMVFGPRVGLHLTAEYIKQHDPRGSIDRTVSSTPDRWHATAADAVFAYGAKDAQGRVEFEASINQKRYENNLDVNQAFDVDTQYVGGIFFYKVMPKTSLLFQASQTTNDYKTDLLGLDNKERQYLVGANWEATALTSGTVKVGHLEKTFDDPNKQGFKGFSWEGTGRWSPRTYSHLTVTTTKSTHDSTGLGNFIVTKQVAVDWYHEWTPRIVSDLNAFTADDRYNGVDRDDKRTGAGAKLIFKARRWLQFAAEYDYLKRDSNLDTFDYTRNLILFSISATL